MIAEARSGAVTVSDGAVRELRSDHTGAAVVTDAHGRYYEAVRAGNVYQLAVANGAVTAFTGGAGGTPLVSVYNPTGSGKNLIILGVSVAPRTAASAAGSVGFSLWGGPSAANTGTLTSPTNLLTLQTSGSVAKGSSNAATTSTTAVNLLMPCIQYYWATAAASMFGNIVCDVAGAIVCAPGNLVAFGGSAALTSATYDAAMWWEEVVI